MKNVASADRRRQDALAAITRQLEQLRRVAWAHRMPADLDDIMQEAWLAALQPKALRAWKPEANTGFFYVIALRHVSRQIARWRRPWSRAGAATLDRLAAPPAARPDIAIEAMLAARKYEAARAAVLATLPPEVQTVARQWRPGASYAEVAAAAGVTRTVAKVAIRRVLRAERRSKGLTPPRRKLEACGGTNR